MNEGTYIRKKHDIKIKTTINELGFKVHACCVLSHNFYTSPFARNIRLLTMSAQIDPWYLCCIYETEK